MLRKRALLFMAAWGMLLAIGAGCGGAEATPTPTSPATKPTPTQTAPIPQATPTPPAALPTATPTRVATTTSPATPVSSPPPPPRAAAGTLRLAVSSFGVESLDPTIERNSNFGIHAAPMYDWLVWNNAEGDLAPGIATNWDMAPDAKSWTFTIRNMRFHNGDPVTAEDVKFTVERITRPAATSSNVGIWRDAAPKGEVLTSNRVKISTKDPSPLMNFLLAPREGSEGAIVPKTLLERLGETEFFQQKPVGTGPWRFVRRDTGIRIVYEAAEARHPFRPTPGYKGLEIILIPEESTRVAMLRTGQAGLVEVAQRSVPAIKEAGLQLLGIPGASPGGINFIGLDEPGFDKFPSSKKEVRQAMTLAINRQEIVDTILGGVGEVLPRWIVVPGTLGYDPAWKPEPYDPDRARQLLRSAGYPRGFDFTVYNVAHPAAPWLPLVVEAAAGYWSALGIATQIIPVDQGTMSLLFRKWPHDELVGRAFGFYGAITSTNLRTLRAWYYSKGTIRQMQSAEWDAIYEKANITLDPEERVRLMRQLVELAQGQYLNIPVAITPALYGAARDIGEWKPVRSGYIGMALETLRPRS